MVSSTPAGSSTVRLERSLSPPESKTWLICWRKSLIGETLTQCMILDKIGEGGMGAAHLAEDTQLKRQVALMLLPESSRRSWPPDPSQPRGFTGGSRRSIQKTSS